MIAPTKRRMARIFSALGLFWLILFATLPAPLQAQAPLVETSALSAEELYQRGHDALSANYKETALNDFTQSCAMGNAKSCFNVGILTESLYPNLAEREDEIDVLIGYYAKSCSLGFQRGCVAQAQINRSERYGRRDLPKAIKLVSDACGANETTGCEDLAEIYYRGEGMNPDLARAAELFKKGCDADGRALSCFDYGLMREQGRGVAKDGAISLHYYRLGCRKGSYPSCINLALDYVARNETDRAKGLFRESCNKDATEACANYGELLRKPDPAHADNATAADLFRKGCEKGYWKSCRQLGQTAQDGTKAAGTKATGIRFFEKGCGLQYAPSCYNAGFSYWIGWHAPESERWALFWFAKGCALKSASSCAGASLAAKPGKKGDRQSRDADSGETPIMTAIHFDSRHRIEKLLRAGAELGLKDKDGDTALHIAARLEQPWNVLELLKAGVPIAERNDEGHSFQHYFCSPKPAAFRTREWVES